MTKFAVAEAALAFVGAAIAGTLWWAHRVNLELPCSSGGGCDIIAESHWAHLTLGPLHDVPTALLGLLGYVLLLAVSLMKLGTEDLRTVRRLHRLSWAVSAGGFFYSWYLQYVAHFKVGAFCVWCFSSACVMTILFVLATWEGVAHRPARV